MTTTQQAFVQVPSCTINAIKQMLFNSKEGVDLSCIIDDIAGDHENKDVVAMNVGLAFKGIRPELDKTVRVTNYWEYGGTVTTAKMTNMSLITGTVDLLTAKYKYDADKETWKEEEEEKHQKTCSLEAWYEYTPTNESDTWEKVANYQKEKGAKKNA